MKKRELTKLIAELDRLTPLQRRQVSAELKAGESKVSSIALVEKGMTEAPHCPHCNSHAVRTCNTTVLANLTAVPMGLIGRPGRCRQPRRRRRPVRRNH